MATAAPQQYVSKSNAVENKFPDIRVALTSRGCSFVQLGRHPKRRPAAGGRGVPQLSRDDRAHLLSVRHHRDDRVWEPAGHGGALQGPSPAVSRRRPCTRSSRRHGNNAQKLKFGLVAPLSSERRRPTTSSCHWHLQTCWLPWSSCPSLRSSSPPATGGTARSSAWFERPWTFS